MMATSSTENDDGREWVGCRLAADQQRAHPSREVRGMLTCVIGQA